MLLSVRAEVVHAEGVGSPTEDACRSSAIPLAADEFEVHVVREGVVATLAARGLAVVVVRRWLLLVVDQERWSRG
jgi:hypothetical protein